MATFLCGAENGILEERPYTDAEFKEAIRAQKKNGFLCSMTKIANDKESHCPPVNDTAAWIKYLNLTYRTPAYCRRITAKRNRVRDYETALFGKSSRCTAKHCAAKIKQEDAAKKQLKGIIEKKCGTPKLSRRYFKCADTVDKSPYGAAAQATMTCRDTQCKKEITAIRKYLLK
jgi:hypothetical protein